MTLARQVEQHRITINNILTIRWPLSLGVATNGIAILDFKQGDSRPLVITSGMEVFKLPSVIWASIEHVSNEPLVSEEFTQVFLLLVFCGHFWIRQEVVDQGKYLIVCHFRLRDSNNGLGLRLRRFWLSDSNRGFYLRDWFSFYLSNRIRNFSLRYLIWRFNLRDWILRLYMSCRIWNLWFRDRFLFFNF